MVSSEPRYTGRRLYGLETTTPEHVVEGQRRIDRREPRARHHQLSCGPQAEPQRAVEANLLFGFEQPAVAALGDEQRDFLGRMDVAVARSRARAAASAAARRCHSAARSTRRTPASTIASAAR